MARRRLSGGSHLLLVLRSFCYKIWKLGARILAAPVVGCLRNRSKGGLAPLTRARKPGISTVLGSALHGYKMSGTAGVSLQLRDSRAVDKEWETD